jgi:hypothetical protein
MWRHDKCIHVFLVRKPEGKRPLGRLKCRWEDGFRMDLREIDWWGGWSLFSWLNMGTGGGLLRTW